MIHTELSDWMEIPNVLLVIWETCSERLVNACRSWMNPKGNSGLLEREWEHYVPQLMDLVLGGTPQQLVPHLPWVFNLSLCPCNALTLGFLKLEGAWICWPGYGPNAIFIYLFNKQSEEL